MFISQSPTNGRVGAPPPQGLDLLVGALKAAGEPSRLRALALLARGELSVGELAQALEQSQPRISRHMKLLTDFDLARRTPEGAWVFYGLPGEESPSRALIDGLIGALDPADPILAADAARLAEIHAARDAAAQAYFARHAETWGQVRALHLPEADLDAALMAAAGPGRFARVIDVGVGAGQALRLFAERADRLDGFDINRQMLAVARAHLSDLPAERLGLRLGDAYRPPIAAAEADLVLMHQVLHFLADPGRAIAAAVNLARPGGRILLVDFAPHDLEFLRAEHAHRRLGFADEEIAAWCANAGAPLIATRTLAPDRLSAGKHANTQKLTVKIWTAERLGPAEEQHI
jgi:SAM-dependent methyltransferase